MYTIFVREYQNAEYGRGARRRIFCFQFVSKWSQFCITDHDEHELHLAIILVYSHALLSSLRLRRDWNSSNILTAVPGFECLHRRLGRMRQLAKSRTSCLTKAMAWEDRETRCTSLAEMRIGQGRVTRYTTALRTGSVTALPADISVSTDSWALRFGARLGTPGNDVIVNAPRLPPP